MTAKSFVEKYFKHFDNHNQVDLITLIITLDELYLNFTKEQVIEIVTAFYDHADEIINDLKENN